MSRLLLFTALAVTAFSSCSVSRTGQSKTPDDVYYSPAREGQLMWRRKRSRMGIATKNTAIRRMTAGCVCGCGTVIAGVHLMIMIGMTTAIIAGRWAPARIILLLE